MPGKPPNRNSQSIARLIQSVERLLKIRPRSVGELRQRLRGKGFDREIVEAVLKEFEAKGVLDDRAFASWWITQRSSFKPTGAFGLLMELKQKRVQEETAKQAILQSGVTETEPELAREALKSRLPRYSRLDPVTSRRRIIDFLSRRGFSRQVIWEIMQNWKGK